MTIVCWTGNDVFLRIGIDFLNLEGSFSEDSEGEKTYNININSETPKLKNENGSESYFIFQFGYEQKTN